MSSGWGFPWSSFRCTRCGSEMFSNAAWEAHMRSHLRLDREEKDADGADEQEPPPCKECGGPTVFYDDTPSRRLFKCEACSTPENYRWTTVPRDEQEPR